MTDPRIELRELPAYAQAVAAIDGRGLKLRYQRDGRGFGITERPATLMSGIGWYHPGEVAVIGVRGLDGRWTIRHYDGHTWERPYPVVDESEIEATVSRMLRGAS